MSTQKKINLAQLDFDTLKDALKAEFANNSTFNTYNFDGSGLSVLLNALAYNTHINSYYANMAVNESYLDTAIKRSNVVSRAQAVGYIPTSATAATAIVDIIVTPQGVASGDLDLFRGQTFTSTVGGYTYEFVTTATTRTTAAAGVYTFSNVELKQGTYLTYSYTVDSSNQLGNFTIPAVDVDMGTLRVRIQTSSGNLTTRTYTKADSILNLDSTSEVYFASEGIDGKYQIYFGDGVSGKKLDVGNIIILDYVSTAKDAPNGSSVFSADLPIGGHTNILVVTKTVAFGGAERESIESIKRYAPINYTSQHRVVTSPDYESFIRHNFQGIESIRAWGGEENVPPIYGKEFVSIKPTSGYVLNNTLKANIRAAIKKVSNGIPIEFIDPVYLKISIDSTVKYDAAQTFRTENQLAGVIQDNITAYFNNTLEKFGTNLIKSAITGIIDNTDSSIIGSTLTTRIRYDYLPLIGITLIPSISFCNPIEKNSFESSVFGISDTVGTIYVKMVDDGNGLIQLMTTEGLVISLDYGTINYTTGVVNLNGLTVTESVDNNGLLSFYAVPATDDISVTANYIITMDTASGNESANVKVGSPIPTMINVGTNS